MFKEARLLDLPGRIVAHGPPIDCCLFCAA
jgi:hypothetical protein